MNETKGHKEDKDKITEIIQENDNLRDKEQ
jgi:hypothetical protein